VKPVSLSLSLALCAALVAVSVVGAGCGGDDPPPEDCAAPGDEDGNGAADCNDLACAAAAACQPACGNGKIEAGETCEDGNKLDGDGCDSNCTKTACGNGIKSMNEGCDDGNTVSGDGCDASCMATGCGNGIKTADEECEDGNTVSGDGCDNNCRFTRCGNGVMTMGEACDDGNAVNGDGCDANCTQTACGNGVLTMGEGCDDGNAVSGDGCDNNCTVTACGNGVLTASEGCDDGNITNGDGCDANCTLTGCGNGVMTGAEACDDGNITNGDGCDANCTITACGNGVRAGAEGCDDGNAMNGDGCDANCTLTGCGNGVQTTGEVCDDGNGVNGDGCDVNCTLPACGNGAVAPSEECDDGNSAPLDGCSAQCVVEPLEKEPNEDGSPSVGGVDINGNDFDTVFANANGAFTRSVVIRGAISPAGDEDVYLFRNTTAQVQTVQLDIWNRALGIGVPCGTTLDTGLHVRDAAGISLVSNDDRNATSDFCSSVFFGLRPGESAYAHVSELGDNGVTPGYVLEARYQPAVCGDGVIGPGEMCEDGNASGGDGCSAVCLIEIAPEAEPNNTLPQAATSPVQITRDNTISGTIKPIAEVDTYRVTVTTPTVVRFEALTSLYDCVGSTIDLRLLDAAGMPIITDIDNIGFGVSMCGAIVAFLDAGTYFISVEEHSNNGIIADYVLQVDYQASRGTEAEAPMTMGSNDTIGTAEQKLVFGNNVYVYGDHQLPDDVDVYQISVPPGARIRAELVEGDRAAETCESLDIDSRLTLFDQNGNQLVDDDDGGRGYCSQIDGTGSQPFDATARNPTATTQQYYVMVRRSTLTTSTSTRAAFVYRLQVTFR
jgi:cysteine-rich repeat protein